MIKQDQIYTTSDYQEFIFFDGNASKCNVSKIIDSIKKYGLINPIVVNQNKEIIDGQHRFESCKALKLPIEHFVKDVKKTNLVELVRDINSFKKIGQIRILVMLILFIQITKNIIKNT